MSRSLQDKLIVTATALSAISLFLSVFALVMLDNVTPKDIPGHKAVVLYQQLGTTNIYIIK